VSGRRNGLPAGVARWLDDRTAALAGGTAVRLGLVRMALRRRERIPELMVLALDQDQAQVASRDTSARAGTGRQASGASGAVAETARGAAGSRSRLSEPCRTSATLAARTGRQPSQPRLSGPQDRMRAPEPERQWELEAG
jgi:hypothetical protein